MLELFVFLHSQLVIKILLRFVIKRYGKSQNITVKSLLGLASERVDHREKACGELQMVISEAVFRSFYPDRSNILFSIGLTIRADTSQ